MRRSAIAAIVAMALALPGSAHGKLDPACTTPTMTSAISGVVRNALGQPLEGMLVELYPSNETRATPDKDFTDATGFYRICAGQQSGASHDTYDVHVRDTTPAPHYATANQPYTTWTNATGDADFTPASGHPLFYLANLTISPAEISTASSDRTVTWTMRSKAPSSTLMRLTLDHLNTTVPMTYLGDDGTPPSAGGWNVWEYSTTFLHQSPERLYWATVRGMSGSVAITETDRAPYVIDNTPPHLGEANSQQCGPGVYANPISPKSPPGTTNPRPIVVHGVCDDYTNGVRSGLDPFSLTGKLCTNQSMTMGCTDISPVLSVNNIVWWPNAAMPVGDYFLRWTISDKAGNTVTTQIGYLLRITDRGGQSPVICCLQPGEIGSGSTMGLIIGSSLTTPTSYPNVGLRVTDADGQTDLVPGSLRVRVYFGDERTLVYDYDPSMPENEIDPISHRGGGQFDLSTGWFKATGFPLQGEPPGRYIATASISDHGGNGASATWNWILVAAS